MAKGKKTGGKDFKPGHGVGRPTSPPEIKAAAKLSMDEARAKLTEYLKLSMPELEAAMKDRTKEAMDLWIIRIVLLGIKNGDHIRLNFMFDRLIGKVTEKVEVKKLTPVIIEYPGGDKTYIGTTED
jgi:hypothetical protein